jgi:rare lipoprotein A
LIRTHSQHGLGTITANSASHRINGVRRHSFLSIARSLRHLRALLRNTGRHTSSLALCIIFAMGSVTTTAAVLAYTHHIPSFFAAQPLAPAPAPPAPPILAKSKPARTHRFVANLEKGIASWYGDVWNGRKTASGETFDDTLLTAAHKTLPLGTIVRVTNLDSKLSVVVRINDRGTLTPERVIDLSSEAARELGMIDAGLAHVKLEILGKHKLPSTL